MPPVTFGRYTIQRELGRGAMGVVYEAHDPVRGVDLALKVMNLPSRGTPEAHRRHVDRFDREARAMASFCHPGLARFYDQGELGGRHYFSMEIVRGTTLRDRLQFQGPLSVSEFVRLAGQLCDILEHIHAQGVVHRDVKPENIMLMPDASAKLMDFGIAQIAADEASHMPGGWQGSPAYMSPEQVAGHVLTGRSDIYSLAITLYECATGRRAVPGDSIPEITRRIQTEYPPPPQGLPSNLQAVLMKALAKDPLLRYPAAGDMAADIRMGRAPALQAPRVMSVPTPGPRPTYLGAPPVATVSPSATPGSPLDSGFLLDEPVATPRNGDRPPADVAATLNVTATCHSHPGSPAWNACAVCSDSICLACLVEAPGRGVLCRRCAFGR